MLASLIERLDPRQLRMLVAGGFALLIAALFSYVLLPQIKEYRQNLAVMHTLEQTVSHGVQIDAELASVEAEVAALEKQLHGDMANLPTKQLEAFVIGRLQTVSWRNGVELVRVEPSSGGTIQVFSESLFKIELSGDYFDLFTWLAEVRAELGFVVIKEYAMRPIEDVARNPRLAVELTLASYRVTQP